MLEWTNGGPTDLENLLRLCGHHHRAIHTGISIEGHPNGELTFTRPDGQEIAIGTDPLQDRLRDRFIGGPAPPTPP